MKNDSDVSEFIEIHFSNSCIGQSKNHSEGDL